MGIDIPSVQAFMRESRVDGWLLYDFRGSNSVLSLLMQRKASTRRAALWIPSTGEPVFLYQGLDGPSFAGCPFRMETYLGWSDFSAWLSRAFAGKRRVAMEYAPGGTLPVVSIVDAGAVELVRGLGVEVVSSADLVQVCVAKWDRDALDGHLRASHLVASAKDSAFAFIGKRLREGAPVNEYDVQQHVMSCFKEAGLETYDPPIVGVNEHSGDPHFDVSPTNPSPIRKGDWILLDLWARLPGEKNIFSDITWMAYCGAKVPTKQREVFEVVRGARDAAVRRAKEAWQKHERIEGWQLDDAARSVIIEAGYGHAIKHRTGHSLSPGPKVHGLGVNLDNLETHDTREVMAGVGYTIEPGVYLKEFGVRLEINVFTDPKTGPRITSCLQEDVVLI